MSRKPKVVTWNGKDIPAELRNLPAGRYLVEPLDEDAPTLTSEEEGSRHRRGARIVPPRSHRRRAARSRNHRRRARALNVTSSPKSARKCRDLDESVIRQISNHCQLRRG